VDPTRYVLEFVFFFLFQPNFDIEISETERGLLPIDIASSQVPVVPSKPKYPDRCAEHLSIIVDIEG
jgi:hypothetical protein